MKMRNKIRNLLGIEFTVIVEEEESGNGFILMRNPLVQQTGCVFINVEIDLIETNATVLKSDCNGRSVR